MAGFGKRRAEVPAALLVLDPHVSKADLWEVVFSLAGLCNGADSCDDEEATIKRAAEEINAYRVERKSKPLDIDALIRRRSVGLSRPTIREIIARHNAACEAETARQRAKHAEDGRPA